MNQDNNKRRVAVVTGSTRGIGRAVAIELARAEYEVVVHGRAMGKQATETLNLIKAVGGKAYFEGCEIGKSEEVRRWGKKIAMKYGIVEVLVNNAGIVEDASFSKMTQAAWDRVINVNLTGVFRVTKAILPLMADGGRIVMVGSVIGLDGGVGQANYAAAKAGLAGLTKTLARELVNRRMGVNLVCPSYTRTEMTAGIPNKVWQTKIRPTLPGGRMLEPEEVARVIVRWCQKQSKLVTGRVVRIEKATSNKLQATRKIKEERSMR